MPLNALLITEYPNSDTTVYRSGQSRSLPTIGNGRQAVQHFKCEIIDS